MILLALDPGQCTGYAIVHYSDVDPATLIESGQIERGVDGFVEWWQSRYPRWWDVHSPDLPDRVVAENFILDGRTPKPDLMPRDILGALRVLSPGSTRPQNTQMKHAPDSFLRRHGLYITGQRHARDAIRHAWAHLKTTHHRPTLEKYWPRDRTL